MRLTSTRTARMMQLLDTGRALGGEPLPDAVSQRGERTRCQVGAVLWLLELGEIPLRVSSGAAAGLSGYGLHDALLILSE